MSDRQLFKTSHHNSRKIADQNSLQESIEKLIPTNMEIAYAHKERGTTYIELRSKM